jgi:ABC-2 type transport system ATP-binding protein
VPEEAQLYTWMSGAEYLTFCARLRGLPGASAARRIDALLTIFGLRPIATRDERVLEGHAAEDPAVGGARPQSAIVVLDEPCSGLDVGDDARHPQPDPAPAAAGAS